MWWSRTQGAGHGCVTWMQIRHVGWSKQDTVVFGSRAWRILQRTSIGTRVGAYCITVLKDYLPASGATWHYSFDACWSSLDPGRVRLTHVACVACSTPLSTAVHAEVRTAGLALRVTLAYTKGYTAVLR